ncbi:MAG: hypothetical protein HKN90_07100 [Flavobacteriaceae bacterium]|nr:hypothetical protein [Flavobacteriaceae bacterium]
MKNIILLLVLIVTVISCKKSDLKSEFNCKSSTIPYETKELRDVLKKFRATIPKNWNTQLYYDEYQSQLYSADTTRSLSEAYIVDISWHQGELVLDNSFDQKVKDTLAFKEKLSNITSAIGKFKNKPCYWNLSKGLSGNHEYHLLQVYIKTEPDEYFTFTTKVIGDQNVDQRLCESIAIYDQLEFIQ